MSWDKLKPVRIQDIDKENREFKANPDAFQPSKKEIKKAEEWWSLLPDKAKVGVREMIISMEDD